MTKCKKWYFYIVEYLGPISTWSETLTTHMSWCNIPGAAKLFFIHTATLRIIHLVCTQYFSKKVFLPLYQYMCVCLSGDQKCHFYRQFCTRTECVCSRFSGAMPKAQLKFNILRHKNIWYSIYAYIFFFSSQVSQGLKVKCLGVKFEAFKNIQTSNIYLPKRWSNQNSKGKDRLSLEKSWSVALTGNLNSSCTTALKIWFFIQQLFSKCD